MSAIPPTKEFVSGGMALSQPLSVGIVRGIQYKTLQVNTTDSYPGLFKSTPQYIDFNFPCGPSSNALNYLNSAYIMIPFTNGDGTNAMKLLPTPFWFSTMSLMINDQPVINYYPQGCMWGNNAVRSPAAATTRNEFEAVTTTAAAYSVYSLAAGATKNFVIPLDNLTFLDKGVLLQGIKSKISIRINFLPGSLILDSTSVAAYTSISVGTVQMICHGQKLAESIYQTALLQSQSVTTVIPIMQSYLKQVVAGPVTGGFASSSIIFNAQLLAAGMLFYVTESGAVKEAAIQPADLDFLTLYDASGQIYNLGETDADLIRMSLTTLFPNTNVLLDASWLSKYYYMSFCKEAIPSIEGRIIHGMKYFEGTEKVQITPTASLTNGIINILQFSPMKTIISPEGIVSIVNL